MSGGISFVDHVKATFLCGSLGTSYGFVVGSAAGYLATALKISKAVTFVNLGIATAVGLGANWVMQYVFRQFDSINSTPWLNAFVHHVALPILSLLSAIYVIPYATLTVYTFAAVGAGAFLLANWLQPAPRFSPPVKG